MRMTLLITTLFLLCNALAANAGEKSVTILGREDDTRVAAVHAAVAFWNQTLAEAGLEDRLVVRSVQPNPIPDAYFLETGSDHGLHKRRPPQEMLAIEGDIVVALADVGFVSFAARLKGGRKFVALRALDAPELQQPGVAENLAAHELGHVLGIRHNDDPKALMCGAPTPCHPARFANAHGDFFPLREQDRAALLAAAREPAVVPRGSETAANAMRQ